MRELASGGSAGGGYAPFSRPVRVLFGNYEPLLNGFISKMLERYLGNGTHVRAEEAGGAAKLIHLAHREPFDLVILILNNIRYDLGSSDAAPGDLLSCALNLIRRLKQALNVPLLALASSPMDVNPDMSEKLRRCGATWFLTLPFQEEDLYGFLRQVFPREPQAAEGQAEGAGGDDVSL